MSFASDLRTTPFSPGWIIGPGRGNPPIYNPHVGLTLKFKGYCAFSGHSPSKEGRGVGQCVRRVTIRWIVFQTTKYLRQLRLARAGGMLSPDLGGLLRRDARSSARMSSKRGASDPRRGTRRRGGIDRQLGLDLVVELDGRQLGLDQQKRQTDGPDVVAIAPLDGRPIGSTTRGADPRMFSARAGTDQGGAADRREASQKVLEGLQLDGEHAGDRWDGISPALQQAGLGAGLAKDRGRLARPARRSGRHARRRPFRTVRPTQASSAPKSIESSSATWGRGREQVSNHLIQR